MPMHPVHSLDSQTSLRTALTRNYYRTTRKSFVQSRKAYVWFAVTVRDEDDHSAVSSRAAVGMVIPMGIPMGMGMVWVWGL